MRSWVVSHLCHLVIEAAVLTLADDAHVFGSIRRFSIGDGDCIVIRLARRHGTPVQIRSIAMTLRLRDKVFLKLLLCKVLLILGARVYTLSRPRTFENVHCLIG